jgi:hypothetical protein
MNPTAFKEADAASRSDITFNKGDLFMASEDNGLIIEAYYFSALWRRFVRMHGGVPIVLLRHPSGAILELRVCPPPNNNWRTGFLGVDLWPAPVSLGNESSGFAMSSPTGELRYNEKKELESTALFAYYPPDIDTSITPMALAFPVRDDPPYKEGDPSPTEDNLTDAIKIARRMPRNGSQGGSPAMPDSADSVDTM